MDNDKERIAGLFTNWVVQFVMVLIKFIFYPSYKQILTLQFGRRPAV